MPLMSPDAYRTFQILAPVSTHFRKATCAEVNCPEYLNGWRTIVPAGSDHADLIRSLKGRYHFTEQALPGLAEFTFPAGQACFQAVNHRIRVERDERFIIRGGDRRAAAGRVHEVSSASWVDGFGENQERLRALEQRG